MKLRTILLVACLMTIPSVAADGSTGCTETEEGLSCHGEVPPPSGGGASTAESCKPIEFDILVTVLPVADYELHLECIA